MIDRGRSTHQPPAGVGCTSDSAVDIALVSHHTGVLGRALPGVLGPVSNRTRQVRQLASPTLMEDRSVSAPSDPPAAAKFAMYWAIRPETSRGGDISQGIVALVDLTLATQDAYRPNSQTASGRDRLRCNRKYVWPSRNRGCAGESSGFETKATCDGAVPVGSQFDQLHNRRRGVWKNQITAPQSGARRKNTAW